MSPSFPLCLAALALTGCAHAVPAAPSRAYACEDGREVLARYPDARTAVLDIAGATHTLTIARSGSGARYVGDELQWWTKGFSEATLATLSAGEDIAPPGVRCVASGA